jgi:hypothetical protein
MVLRTAQRPVASMCLEKSPGSIDCGLSSGCGVERGRAWVGAYLVVDPVDPARKNHTSNAQSQTRVTTTGPGWRLVQIETDYGEMRDLACFFPISHAGTQASCRHARVERCDRMVEKDTPQCALKTERKSQTRTATSASHESQSHTHHTQQRREESHNSQHTLSDCDSERILSSRSAPRALRVVGSWRGLEVS